MGCSMLYKISIENFFSIADIQEVSFIVHCHAPDMPCFRKPHTNSDVRVPVVVGFFGANASGKSTILQAITSSALFVLHSFNWQDEINLLFQPYRQKKWWGKPTKITMEFDSRLSNEMQLTKFRYELHIAHEANNFSNKTILYEALFYAPKGKFRRLFERHGQEFYFGQEFDIPNANDPRTESIRDNASVISTLAKLNHVQSKNICQLIGALQTNDIGFGKIPQSSQQLLSNYANDQVCLDQLNQELRRFDIELESMFIEQGNQGLFAKFKHLGLDEFIFLEEESAGTQRFIKIFPKLHYALATGSLAVIDELDTDFHPLLLPELFRWFNDPVRNLHNAQLIFTAHNPALLDDLEKEQIFFVEKASGRSTAVYCARDIAGLRRDPSLMKKYLSGLLGAVPQIG